MAIDNQKFAKAKKESKKFYSEIDEVYCAYLKEKVYFNDKGFNHILTKTWNRGRSDLEQYTRLRLLPKAVEVVKRSTTLQEYDEGEMMVRQKINSRWEKRLKNVKYFVFVSLYPDAGVRLKVIVKYIEGGKPYFWSVYPSWRVSQNINGENKKMFYKGNLEED